MRVTTILFRNKISQEEVYYLRGAVARLADYATIFHNHLFDKYKYAYPLVQYKRIGGRAAIVGIERGAVALEALFGEGKDMDIELGNRNVTLHVESIYTRFCDIAVRENIQTYSVTDWLPLNNENNSVFRRMHDEDEQVRLLHKILVGNILSTATGMGVHFAEYVTCEFVQLEQRGTVNHKGIDMKCFNAVFRTNVSLPNFIGIGRNVSTGHGTVTREQ